MSDQKKGLEGASREVVFIIPKFTPGACGLSDYTFRMANLLSAEGIESSIHTNYFNSDKLNFPTLLNKITVSPIGFRKYGKRTLLALQYTPRMWRDCIDLVKTIMSYDEPKRLLMLHEIWRFDTHDYRYSFREKLGAFKEKYLTTSFVRRLSPAEVAVSNSNYRDELQKHRISSSISPMPGTIEQYHVENGEGGYPNSWKPSEDEFLWVALGNLNLRYWDYRRFLKNLTSIESDKHHRFLILGRQSADDRSNFLTAANAAGLRECIKFTGPVSFEEIDHALGLADAAFTGTGHDLWEKSTGVLACVERGLPVYVPRQQSGTSQPEMCPLLSNDLAAVIRMERNPVAARQSSHWPEASARRFISDFVISPGLSS